MSEDARAIASDAASALVEPRGWWARCESLLERASEHLNPLLVKEARQALKSNQFATTFILVMCLGWGWSFLGVAVSDNPLTVGPDGRGMLYGYFLILVVALFLIVPFSAFRSLAAEREDGTLALIAITTLSARQIVFGKLGSALVQMLVYLSALAPCIAFTALLRGVDIYLIALLMGVTISVSAAMSACGLMFASLSRSGHWQSALSALLVLGFAVPMFVWLVMAYEIFVDWNRAVLDGPLFWMVFLNVATVAWSFVALFCFTAASQLSFLSDNRATALRVVMMVQQVLAVGWCTFYTMVENDAEFLGWLVFLSGMYWGIVGVFMTGESPQLSPRVLRGLPQSLLGRAFFSWFNPGSGTGYVFAIANMGAVLVYAVGFGIFHPSLSRSSVYYSQTLYSLLLIWSYLAIYLGVGRLFLVWLRRRVQLSLPLVFLVHLLLHVFGNFVPFVMAISLDNLGPSRYSLILLPSWMATIDATTVSNPFLEFVVVLVGGTGILFFVVNLVLAAKELGYQRIATPERVAIDDLELHPELRPTTEKSPWD